jgi:transcriptional regulator
MYQPPHFREDRIEVLHALIREFPFGLLITAGAGGLMANPVPFVIDAEGSQLGVLRCHLAKANPQWRELECVEECLAVFQGPESYVTPSWYATKRETGKVVPTWNYAMVQACGRPQVIHHAAWLRRQIGDLTMLKEQGRSSAWSVDDAPAEFISAQIKGIVGIEIAICRIEGKWKVSQNRPESDRNGVVAGLISEGGNEEMAKLVAERGRTSCKN